MRYINIWKTACAFREPKKIGTKNYFNSSGSCSSRTVPRFDIVMSFIGGALTALSCSSYHHCFI
ncbi:hypothetical protein NQ317_009271 [Molorchus minor]|uniref:Uncharacterized protein n=1 Tax=Molorchus minor TaxID=1323400 RepID=A0ABQ9ISI1_9CUCU|nr:hypothetical protein NQ317_009271 [Molorchus minor]